MSTILQAEWTSIIVLNQPLSNNTSVAEPFKVATPKKSIGNKGTNPLKSRYPVAHLGKLVLHILGVALTGAGAPYGAVLGS